MSVGVCGESTLRHGHDLGYNVAVLEDVCAAFVPAQRKHVLEDVIHHYGEHITVDKFIGLLEREESSVQPVAQLAIGRIQHRHTRDSYTLPMA